MEIARIGIVGCGLMGAGIAEECALAGTDVVVLEVDDAAASLGLERIEKSLRKTAAARGLGDDEADTALGRLSATIDIDTFADRDLVVEAVAEAEDLKLDVFERLDKVTRPDAILTSNTSSIPIAKLASATHRGGRVIGTHFFNPVPRMPLVEIVPSLVTDPAVVEGTRAFLSKGLGKQVIESKDRAGFIVNKMLVPFLLSAVRMLEEEFATVEDIDAGMKGGAGHPMGPLELQDMIGLDTMLLVAESLYEEYKEALYAPPPLLRRMVDAGLYGQKAGRGFYDYSHA